MSRLIGVLHAYRWLRLCLLLVGSYCGSAEVALAASMVDFTETEDDIFWMFGWCLTSGTIGFGIGYKVRFTRDLANAA